MKQVDRAVGGLNFILVSYAQWVELVSEGVFLFFLSVDSSLVFTKCDMIKGRNRKIYLLFFDSSKIISPYTSIF